MELPETDGAFDSEQVLDLGQVVAGNFCGGLMAYFGADVIKVRGRTQYSPFIVFYLPLTECKCNSLHAGGASRQRRRIEVTQDVR